MCTDSMYYVLKNQVYGHQTENIILLTEGLQPGHKRGADPHACQMGGKVSLNLM